jgi:hypothetical protein
MRGVDSSQGRLVILNKIRRRKWNSKPPNPRLTGVNSRHVFFIFHFFFEYPSSIFGPIYECRCDERLKTKDEESTRLEYTRLIRGTGTPKNSDEVNRRDVCECDG